MKPEQKIRTKFFPESGQLIKLESFIREIVFLSESEKNRLLLIATELFENILAHAPPKKSRLISVGVSKKRSSIHMSVSWHVSFCNYSASEHKLKYFFEDATKKAIPKFSGAQFPGPQFDPVLGRYHGMGLRMCHNLSAAMKYKKGLFKRSIIIIL